MQKFVKAANLRYATGETNVLEKNVAIAKQQELEQEIKQNETRIFIEKEKLKTLLNLDSDFEVSETTFSPIIATVDSTQIIQNTSVQLANNQIKIAEANHKLEKAAFFPEFSAGYFMQSMNGNQEVNGQMVTYDSSLSFTGFSVGVSLPIFMGSTMAKSKAAQTRIALEKQNLSYLQAQVESQFLQQNKQLKTYKSLVDYYIQIAVPNANEILKNASKGYLNGAISYHEYVNSLETALKIQMNYGEAILNYNQTIINLQYLTNQ